MTLRAFRAAVLHCLADPGTALDTPAVEYFADGLLLVQDGRVVAVGPATELLPQLPTAAVLTEYRDKLIVPGFIDTHCHYVQVDVIAAYGEQLLTWLEKYTFPAERRFADPAHAQAIAEVFVQEMLRNGTTTALIMGSVHAHSADALFSVAERQRLRVIAGKVMMDRNCPDYLRDTAESGYSESKTLIERWHGRDRLLYAVTPRFAGSSTPAQLRRSRDLLDEHPGVYLHTHLSENRAECAWVAGLFPDSKNYLDVYDHFGLVRERAVFAHSIHLADSERARLGATGAAVAFCPACNLFLGSGLFDLQAADAHGMRVGLGSDIGGGTTFSLLKVMDSAYKVAQLQSQTLTPYRALYLATLGGARALYLDDRIGNFAPGKEADFVVLDPAATPLLARRSHASRTAWEQLFALIVLGDDRSVAATYALGAQVYPAPEQCGAT